MRQKILAGLLIIYLAGAFIDYISREGIKKWIGEQNTLAGWRIAACFIGQGTVVADTLKFI